MWPFEPRARAADAAGRSRSVTIAETRARAERLRATIDVVRLGETTRLDLLDIPTAVAVRARVVEPSITVSSGKGRTPDEALAGALLEAYERWCAEPRGRIRLVRGAHAELAGAIDPASLVLASWSRWSPEVAIEWCEGISLVSGARRLVPANAVFFPYEPRAEEQLFAAHTTGLGAGASLEDALCHGLFECIERDRYGHLCAELAAGENLSRDAIDPATLDPASAELRERIASSGTNISLRDLTGDSGVPTILAIVERDGLVHRGAASRARAELAAFDALTEAAQSRATDIQGAREDLGDPARAERPHPWFTASVGTRAPFPSSIVFDRVDEELRWLVERAHAMFGHEPVAVDLSLAGSDLHAVRVVTPGAEHWADDPDREGPHVRRSRDRT